MVMFAIPATSEYATNNVDWETNPVSCFVVSVTVNGNDNTGWTGFWNVCWIDIDF